MSFSLFPNPSVLFAALTVAAACRLRSCAEEPPVIPVGLDAYRMWDRWPYQRIGARAYLRSTYDRAGGNEGADASHFLYQAGRRLQRHARRGGARRPVLRPLQPLARQPLALRGRRRRPRRSGDQHAPTRSSPSPDSIFLPETRFPNPLAWTWSATKGADLTWVPIRSSAPSAWPTRAPTTAPATTSTTSSCRGAQLSRPIRAWDGKTPPDARRARLIARAGNDLAPRPDTPKGKRSRRQRGVRDSRPAGQGGGHAGPSSTEAPAMLRALEFDVPQESAAGVLGRARCASPGTTGRSRRSTRRSPLFFGAGTLYNRDGREYLVKAFPIAHPLRRQPRPSGLLLPDAVLPLGPHRAGRHGRRAIPDVRWSVRDDALPRPAQPRRLLPRHLPRPPQARSGARTWSCSTPRKAEGGGDWSGHFVGTSFIFSHDANLGTLEGDPRFFFDDSHTPQAQGTGTEEWGGGGDYWGGRNMTLPFAGHPVGARGPKAAKDDGGQDRVGLPLPAGRPDALRQERPHPAGARRHERSTEHYETVTYWYGLPSPSLRQDRRAAGRRRRRARRRTRYHLARRLRARTRSRRATSGASITLTARRVYPGAHRHGPAHEGHVGIHAEAGAEQLRRPAAPQARLRIPQPAGGSVRGRRQPRPGRARRWTGSRRASGISPARTPASIPTRRTNWAPRSTTSQTSNRRFRDDEFLVPRDLTAGRSAIRVRVQFTPVKRPLFPGRPLGELAWSEIHYSAYCFVTPEGPAVEQGR